MKHLLLSALSMGLISVTYSQTFTFSYTGDLDTLVIPNCVDSVLINAWGAQGGETTFGGAPGKGAFVSVKMDVSAGDTLYVNVGGQDGYNGGGAGGYGTASDGVSDFAGNGGGASDVRIGGTTLTDRKLVAAGGGGAGRNYVNGSCQPCGIGGDGGDGGITNGVDGVDAVDIGWGGNPGGAGKGGTQLAGGDGGLGVEGAAGNPGVIAAGGQGIDGNYSVAGGGGGGGYYGGGSGANANSGSGVAGSGGAGGSSYYDTGSLLFVNALPGIRTGNGQITVTFILSTPIMTTTVSQLNITLTALQPGVSYQWLNCGTGYSTVPGATNQAFTATANGTYAVELDNNNGCVDTSACFTISEVGISEMNALNMTIFPNPASNELQIQLNNSTENCQVRILDANGKVAMESSTQSSYFTLDISTLDKGFYLVEINSAGLISRAPLIKQ